eukprot:TRINITY_DN4407_c0_g1_i2.p1 TRINITY_DN4407_c0_g1~~TRINITY_DN4407_c0_g1_i2.p1  ORF type:complete len:355 (+),score=73.30 TRINITY_DN4407_c0_g1_i2:159-1223(+)
MSFASKTASIVLRSQFANMAEGTPASAPLNAQQESNGNQQQAVVNPTQEQLLAAANPQLLFELSVLYYKQHISELDYDSKTSLSALYKQSTLGKFDESKSEAPGFFDFVGKERRAAWQALGDLSQVDAQKGFRDVLLEARSDFKDWLGERLAAKFRAEHEERIRAARQAELVRQEKLRQERARQVQLQRQQEEARRKQLAMQQEQQEQQQQQRAAPTAQAAVQNTPKSRLSSPEYIEAFREALKGHAESEATVASGEVLTVRVPKPGKGRTQITWQFNTLDYDIQFGVDFEHKANDGALTTQVVVPVARIEAHAEVVTGTHTTEHEGTWLLKFDNSYSYFRSKVVMYRVLCAAV